jgi:hypothetical protein
MKNLTVIIWTWIFQFYTSCTEYKFHQFSYHKEKYFHGKKSHEVGERTPQIPIPPQTISIRRSLKAYLLSSLSQQSKQSKNSIPSPAVTQYRVSLIAQKRVDLSTCLTWVSPSLKIIQNFWDYGMQWMTACSSGFRILLNIILRISGTSRLCRRNLNPHYNRAFSANSFPHQCFFAARQTHIFRS